MTYNTSPGRAQHFNLAPTWQSWITLLIAIWFFVSPWVLQFAAGGAAGGAPQAAPWNAWVLSVVIALVTLSAMGAPAVWQPWANLLLAIWVFIAPWVLGFANTTPAWDHWVCGVLFALLAISRLTTAPAATRVGPGVAEAGYAGSKPPTPGNPPGTM
jgi:hypothetical protein